MPVKIDIKMPTCCRNCYFSKLDFLNQKSSCLLIFIINSHKFKDWEFPKYIPWEQKQGDCPLLSLNSYETNRRRYR